MEEVVFINILKTVSWTVSIVGLLVGVDLLLGGKVIFLLKRVMAKSIDFDKNIIEIMSSIKEKLDKPVFHIDELIVNTKIRIVLGILFIVSALLIISLISRV